MRNAQWYVCIQQITTNYCEDDNVDLSDHE